jgi:hypothetical protein
VTPKQKEMARHALGLPNAQKRSYRNRYVVSRDNADWKALLASGHAGIETTGYVAPTALFYLTPKGARAALDLGESLDPEDFPAAALPTLYGERTT